MEAAIAIDPIPPVVAVAAVISLRDESDLAWYFGPGQSHFERSTFGSMISHADIKSKASQPCKRCNSIGFTDEDVRESAEWFRRNPPPKGASSEAWETWLKGENGRGGGSEDNRPKCKPCDGMGVLYGRQKGLQPSVTGYKRCFKCRGCGNEVFKPRGSKNTLLTGSVCPTCDGVGYVVREPALCGKEDEHPGYLPDEGALQRFALVSRRLDRVAAEDRSLVTVLQAFYGDMGSRWGRTRHGRTFAVYCLTPAGMKLARQQTESGLPAHERIGVEAELEKTQPKPNRRALLNAADVQARELIERAASSWNRGKP